MSSVPPPGAVLLPQQRRLVPPLPRPGTTQPPPPTAQQEQRQLEQQEWREREHRQRTIRLLMMFLMMLLLMDEDTKNDENVNRNKNYNGNSHNPNNNEAYRLRGSIIRSDSSVPYSGWTSLNQNNEIRQPQSNVDIEENYRRRVPIFLHHRQTQDDILQNITQRHERYQRLLHDKNHNRDYVQHIHEWCQQQMDIVKDEFFITSQDRDTTSTQRIDTNGIIHEDGSSSSSSSGPTTNEEHNSLWLDDKTIAYHYPWNTTGFYRGSWKRIVPTNQHEPNTQQQVFDHRNVSTSNRSITTNMIQLLSTVIQNDRILFERHGMGRDKNSSRHSTESHSDVITNEDIWVDAVQIQEEMLQRLRYRHQLAAIVPLPFGMHLRPYDDDTRHKYNKKNTTTREISSDPIQSQGSGENDKWHDGDGNNNEQSQQQRRIAGMNEYSSKDILSQTIASLQQQPPRQRPGDMQEQQMPSPTITLTRDDGRAAFQLFGRRIVGMKELSYVSGFLKLYDSTAAGYSTRKDVLLRVQGVLIHSIGRMSLVANTNEDAMAFVIDPSFNSNSDDKVNAHRRLQEAVRSLVMSSQTSMYEQSGNKDDLISIRNEVIALFGSDVDNENKRRNNNDPQDILWKMNDVDEDAPSVGSGSNQKTATKTASPDNKHDANLGSIHNIQLSNESHVGYTTDIWSDIVIPHPFVHDDTYGYSVLNSLLTSPTSNMIPLQERTLEKNAAGCSFEIAMDIAEVEYTVGAWKRLLLQRYTELQMMDPSSQRESETNGGNKIGNQRMYTANNNDYANRHVRPYTSSWSSPHISRDYPKEAMAMKMVGEIHSYTCNFHAQINTTALRTDWDATTSKAINYSFYMMLVCLIQIFILLRQLLHSQSPSVATRVSLICIGWQTIIDALLCLVHIYLSLAVQPLFTAFASVAFFKLLIFCVIEMKYMAIILQARNNSGGATITADELRHQVAVLHIRFYVALVAIFLFIFYSPGRNRTYIILALYSFWVPQIILNIVTEAKAPLHKHYIYGMSLTRVIAPLYIFGLQNNFLKEVYPDSTTDSLLCQILVLWVGCQTAILIAQGKYGARFMIPKRFLPPKFDYNRPIPTSMLPPGALLDLPSPESMEDRANDGLQAKGSSKREDGDSSTSTTHPHNNRESNLRSAQLRHQTADTTRNRHNRGGRLASTVNPPHSQRGRNNNRTMVKEDMTVLPRAKPSPAPVLECSICYENIDVRDRLKYMLAPCNHLYHSECLKQWMEVKMECPICRTSLPPL